MHETWPRPAQTSRGAPRDASLAAEARVTEHPLSARAAPRPAGRRRLQRARSSTTSAAAPRRPRSTSSSRTELEPLPHLKLSERCAVRLGLAGQRARWSSPSPCLRHHESRPTNLVRRTFWRRDRGVAWTLPVFVLSHGDVALWLMIAFSDAEPPPHDQNPDGHVDMGWRAARWIRSRLEASMSASNVMALDLVACGSRHGRAGTGSSWRSTPCFRLPAVVTYF